MKDCFGTYDGHSDGCVRCNDYDCIVKTHQNQQRMNVEQMQKALDEILNMYKEMEREYGVGLTEQYVRVEQVKNDIPEAIWYAECGKNL